MIVFLSAGCNKAQEPAKADPHSRVGVMRTLMEQADLLKDAVARQDFKYVHDFMYYFDGLAVSLRSKLTPEQEQRVGGWFEELAGISHELDDSSGRKQAEATQANMKRLEDTLLKIEDQLRSAEPPG